MNEYDARSPRETIPAERARRARVRRSLPNRSSGWIATAVLTCAVIGLAGCAATAPTATPASPAAAPASPSADAGQGRPASGGGGSNARSEAASGGASGTVDGVSASGFTMSTSAGQQVTVNEASSTTYQDGTESAAASDITDGDTVLVLGMTSGTTITATQVIVQPDDGGGSAASAAAGVIPFQRGTPSPAKQDGEVPSNYTQGEGTIVSGTEADQATEAALAAYPGGVVDRVVQLSSGAYEVHYIGVNWPHHIFVDTDFTVAGAN